MTSDAEIRQVEREMRGREDFTNRRQKGAIMDSA